MTHKKINDRYVVSLDKGEEVIKTLTEFCAREEIKFGEVTAIGAADNIQLGYFEPHTKEYHTRTFQASHEISNMTGNVSLLNGKVCLHCHITLASRDFHALAGHLVSAIVSGAFEAVVHKLAGEVGREFNKEVGLNLFKLP